MNKQKRKRDKTCGSMGEKSANGVLFVYADASVQPNGTGLGAVIKNVDGKLIDWRNKSAPAMTCNEAEYAALIFALEETLKFKPRTVHVYSDSRLVVEQMRGYISVNRSNLKQLHQQARALQERFEICTFTHIPRDLNQLADAIADEAARKTVNSEQRTVGQ